MTGYGPYIPWAMVCDALIVTAIQDFSMRSVPMTMFSNFPGGARYLARLGISALTAGTLTLTGWVSLAAIDVCGSAALASHQFGRDGRDGRNGRAGRNGRDSATP